ncbi:thermostable hemolysin [Glaciecola sp. 1036]|uniref:thermostable hemolysin n=1 Tax=Alteromonadaceae TaxID=72275 RepID=UPI003D08FE33
MMQLLQNTNLAIQIGNKTKCANATKFAFDIALHLANEIGRDRVEDFIKQGFKKAYGAEVNVSMPWLLSISKGDLKAALGIRPATSTLFIEQYIDVPIEQAISVLAPDVNRHQIAEIGHLYSNSNRFTIPLFMVTAISLLCNNYEYMVFSATEHVLSLITRAGINCSQIAKADVSKLTPPVDNWGSYYDTNPVVVAVSLYDVVQAISNDKGLASVFADLDEKIARTTEKLNKASSL